MGDNRDHMLALIDRMTPGDMPDFEPLDGHGATGLRATCTDAAVKHMIIISDGDPSAAQRTRPSPP